MLQAMMGDALRKCFPEAFGTEGIFREHPRLLGSYHKDISAFPAASLTGVGFRNTSAAGFLCRVWRARFPEGRGALAVCGLTATVVFARQIAQHALSKIFSGIDVDSLSEEVPYIFNFSTL